MAQTIPTRLYQMTSTTPTALWNDSCSTEELSASIANNGAVGATANPVIVLGVLKKELALWKDRIPRIIREMDGAAEDGVAWRLVEEMSVKAAKLLEPILSRKSSTFSAPRRARCGSSARPPRTWPRSCGTTCCRTPDSARGAGQQASQRQGGST